MARTGDREIRSESGGVAISGFGPIFILMDTKRRLTRRLNLFFPSSSHVDYEFLVQTRRFYNSKDLEN